MQNLKQISKIVNKKIIISSISAVLLILPTVIMAQTLQGITNNVATIVINVLYIIADGFIIFMFVLAGFKYLTAQGDPSKVSEANKAVIWALAGIAVVVLASFMRVIVQNTLGL